MRETGALTVEEAVRKMTSQAARAFGLTDVGTIAKGMRANLVAFEMERVEDTATFAEPVSFPVGIEYVVVGGVVAVARGSVMHARRGRVVRRNATA